MAIKFRAALSGDNGATASLTQVVTLPTGWQPGDFCVIGGRVGDSTGTFTTPAGWTIINAATYATGGYSYCFYYRILQAGDTNPTLTYAAVASTWVWVSQALFSSSGGTLVFAAQGAAVAQNATAGTTFTPTAASANGGTNASIVISVGRNNAAVTPTGFSTTPAAGWTTGASDAAIISSGGNTRTAGIYYQLSVPSGTVTPGAFTFTLTGVTTTVLFTAQQILVSELMPAQAPVKTPTRRLFTRIKSRITRGTVVASATPGASFVGVGKINVSGSASFVFPLATGTGWVSGPSAPVVAGDTIILAVEMFNAATTMTWPSGFTQVITTTGSNGNVVLVATKTATGTEGASVTATASASTWGDGVAYVLRGITSATPLHTAVNNTSVATTALAAPALTIGGPTDVTVYGYNSGLTGNTGSQTVTVPGTLSNPLASPGSQGTGDGCCTNIGWGINVSAPGAGTGTTTTEDCVVWALDFAASSGVATVIKPAPIKTPRRPFTRVRSGRITAGTVVTVSVAPIPIVPAPVKSRRVLGRSQKGVINSGFAVKVVTPPITQTRRVTSRRPVVSKISAPSVVTVVSSPVPIVPAWVKTPKRPLPRTKSGQIALGVSVAVATAPTPPTPSRVTTRPRGGLTANRSKITPGVVVTVSATPSPIVPAKVKTVRRSFTASNSGGVTAPIVVAAVPIVTPVVKTPRRPFTRSKASGITVGTVVTVTIPPPTPIVSAPLKTRLRPFTRRSAGKISAGPVVTITAVPTPIVPANTQTRRLSPTRRKLSGITAGTVVTITATAPPTIPSRLRTILRPFNRTKRGVINPGIVVTVIPPLPPNPARVRTFLRPFKRARSAGFIPPNRPITPAPTFAITVKQIVTRQTVPKRSRGKITGTLIPGVPPVLFGSGTVSTGVSDTGEVSVSITSEGNVSSGTSDIGQATSGETAKGITSGRGL